MAVEFTDPDGRRHEEVLVLLVANNSYQLQRASELGARDRLDEGVLQVSALRARTGAALARVVAKATVGRAGSGAAWAQWETAVLRVDSKLPELPAGVDGEMVVLSTPLEFRMLPRALSAGYLSAFFLILSRAASSRFTSSLSASRTR